MSSLNLAGFRWILVAAAFGVSSASTELSAEEDRAAPRLEIVTSAATGMKLVLIPAGEFQMGSSDEDVKRAVKNSPSFPPEAAADEQPQHRVRISRSFYLGVHEVTVGQFRKFVEDESYKTDAERDGAGGKGFLSKTGGYEQGTKYNWRNPGYEQTDDHPVVNVTWRDTKEFCAWLSRKDDATYRLPTEAEWEYAARAGTTTLHISGNDPESVVKIGNTADGTARARYREWTTIKASDTFINAAPVGQFAPNPFGLRDMTGNVWEWCQDDYVADAYSKRNGVSVDPIVSEGIEAGVLRGGSWFSDGWNTRPAVRYFVEGDYRDNDAGFRVTRTHDPG